MSGSAKETEASSSADLSDADETPPTTPPTRPSLPEGSPARLLNFGDAMRLGQGMWRNQHNSPTLRASRGPGQQCGEGKQRSSAAGPPTRMLLEPPARVFPNRRTPLQREQAPRRRLPTGDGSGDAEGTEGAGAGDAGGDTGSARGEADDSSSSSSSSRVGHRQAGPATRKDGGVRAEDGADNDAGAPRPPTADGSLRTHTDLKSAHTPQAASSDVLVSGRQRAAGGGGRGDGRTGGSGETGGTGGTGGKRRKNELEEGKRRSALLGLITLFFLLRRLGQSGRGVGGSSALTRWGLAFSGVCFIAASADLAMKWGGGEGAKKGGEKR